LETLQQSIRIQNYVDFICLLFSVLKIKILTNNSKHKTIKIRTLF